jgi:preprotein translocase subunit SecA
MMEGRRYSDGLHQALEAKEFVTVQPENQTLASITFQNYFRLYPEAGRHDRHGGDRGGRVRRDLQARVVEIPTNVPVARKDEDDEVYRTAMEKYEAVIALIDGGARQGQPCPVGTPSSRSRSRSRSC